MSTAPTAPTVDELMAAIQKMHQYRLELLLKLIETHPSVASYIDAWTSAHRERQFICRMTGALACCTGKNVQHISISKEEEAGLTQLAGDSATPYLDGINYAFQTARITSPVGNVGVIMSGSSQSSNSLVQDGKVVGLPGGEVRTAISMKSPDLPKTAEQYLAFVANISENATPIAQAVKASVEELNVNHVNTAVFANAGGYGLKPEHGAVAGVLPVESIPGNGYAAAAIFALFCHHAAKHGMNCVILARSKEGTELFKIRTMPPQAPDFLRVLAEIRAEKYPDNPGYVNEFLSSFSSDKKIFLDCGGGRAAAVSETGEELAKSESYMGCSETIERGYATLGVEETDRICCAAMDEIIRVDKTTGAGAGCA